MFFEVHLWVYRNVGTVQINLAYMKKQKIVTLISLNSVQAFGLRQRWEIAFLYQIKVKKMRSRHHIFPNQYNSLQDWVAQADNILMLSRLFYHSTFATPPAGMLLSATLSLTNLERITLPEKQVEQSINHHTNSEWNFGNLSINLASSQQNTQIFPRSTWPICLAMTARCILRE